MRDIKHKKFKKNILLKIRGCICLVSHKNGLRSLNI